MDDAYSDMASKYFASDLIDFVQNTNKRAGISPFDLHKRVLRAHIECTNYFNELAAYKSDLIEKGDQANARTMDIMGMRYSSHV